MSEFYDQELVARPETPQDQVDELAKPYISGLSMEKEVLLHTAQKRLMGIALRHGADSPEVARSLAVWADIIYGNPER